jgi:hypothetical protein
MTFDIRYAEISLDDILAHFVKGFEFKDSSTLYKHEAFIDIGTRKVMFKLTVELPILPDTAPRS